MKERLPRPKSAIRDQNWSLSNYLKQQSLSPSKICSHGPKSSLPVAGEVVVIPFPRTDPTVGKRRPALVIADLPGADLILCQITSRAHSDAFSVPLDSSDFERGQLGHPSFIRPQRLFTVEHRVTLYSIGKMQAAKLDEVLRKVRELFS